jgi:hypothetical protein
MTGPLDRPPDASKHENFLVCWSLGFPATLEDVPDFSSPPDHWPVRAKNVLYLEGRYGDLAGQLAFNFEFAGTQVVAVGLPEERPPGRVWMEGSTLRIVLGQ